MKCDTSSTHYHCDVTVKATYGKVMEEGHAACEIIPVPGCSYVQGTRKRKRSSEDESPIKWGLGFIGEAEEPEGGVEWEEMQRSGYHSATTEIISDSEDDLFFLDDVSYQEVEEVVGYEVEEVEGYEVEEVEWEEEWIEEEVEDEEDEDVEDQEEEEDEDEDQVDEREGEQEKDHGSIPQEPCIICLSKPRDASIIHGQTGHQVCYIGCATRLKEEKKKCPLCRKKIKLVVKNYF